MTRTCQRVFLFLTVAAVAAGQMQSPKNNRYEVVSIKPGVQGPCGPRFSALQFSATNCSVEYLIKAVSGSMRGYDLVGLPKWTSSAWYTITAKSIGLANPSEQWAMLGPVLEDRFKLKWHREKRQMPVYYLSTVNGGVKLPLTVPGSCVPMDPNVGPPPPGRKTPAACGRFLQEIRPQGEVKLDVSGITMAQLASFVENHLGRPVLDRTGSKDLFDVHLNFVKTDATVSDTNAEPLGLPSIVGALKKAGLTVTRGQGPVEVMVIDRVERPSEN
jgi:uncharacterized protein (TIGR03435 family)